MQSWEFLLQKEGDRVWLPLESPDVEILEGRYRVIARSNCANTDIKICMTHQSWEEKPSQTPLHTRNTRTNEQGLMVVIPYTRLTPGIWDLTCTLDRESDETVFERKVKQTLKLQVLPNDAELGESLQRVPSLLEDPIDSSPGGLMTDVVDSLPPHPHNDDNSFAISDVLSHKETPAEDTLSLHQSITLEQIPAQDSLSLNESITFEEIPAQDSLSVNESITFEEIPAQDNLSVNESITFEEISAQDSSSFHESITFEEIPAQDNLSLNESYQVQTEDNLSPHEPISESNVKVEETLAPQEDIDLEEDVWASPSDTPQFSLKLTLEQNNFITQLGKPLTLYGRVDVPEFDSASPNGLTEIQEFSRALKLQINLRDPQTSQVLAEVEQNLPEIAPPWVFSCTLYIPTNCKTRLFLADATLSQGKRVLMSESFTLTADLSQILTVIEESFNEEEYHASLQESKRAEESLNQSFLDLVASLKDEYPGTDFDLDPEPTLPPQIKDTPSGVLTPLSLDLPSFGQKIPEEMRQTLEVKFASNPNVFQREIPSESRQIPLPATVEEWVKPETSITSEKEEKTPEIGEQIAPTEEKEDTMPFGLSAAIASPAVAPSFSITPSPSPNPVANNPFQALQLKDRFWSRLNSLANDTELLEWLKTTNSEGDLLSPGASGNPQEEGENLTGITTETEERKETAPIIKRPSGKGKYQEIVVDDYEPLVIPQRQPKTEQKQGFSQRRDTSLSASDTNSYVFAENEVIPVPELIILNPEIIAGRVVKVRIQLPEMESRVYVKLWVYDRQTYTILEEPRWLTDLKPNGIGLLETVTDIEIPYGSLEVEFAAIAVELPTQRESHKATIFRNVVPPPPPTLPLENRGL